MQNLTEGSSGVSIRMTSASKIHNYVLFGLFTETELAGMLQATKHDAVDKVSSSLESIVDKLCGLDGYASF